MVGHALLSFNLKKFQVGPNSIQGQLNDDHPAATIIEFLMYRKDDT